jgi:hypothetical protein
LLPWRCNASNAIFCHDEGCRKGRVGTCRRSPPSSNAANASTIQASWLVSYKLPTRSPGGRAVAGGGGGTGDRTGMGRGRRQRRRGTAARQVGGRWAATAAVGNCCSPGGRAVGGGGGETGDGGVGGGGELWLGTRTELPQVLWDPRWEDRTGSRDVGELEGKPTKKKPRGKTGSS